MRNALENPKTVDSCLEFFGLERLPFAPLPETKPIFRAQQYAFLESHIADMLNEPDRLFVLRGADGSGKTTLLKRYLGSLSNASIALIDETCKDGTDFYCSFLQQIGFEEITGTLTELRTITREFLVHRATASDHVLLVLDNAPRIHPAVLEQLRWISGIQRDKRRVLSVVISGNSELDRILASPAMAGLRYENNLNFTVRAFTSAETAGYIRHRLHIFGCGDALQFTAGACDLVHRYAGGLAQSINHIGNLLLAEAASRELRTIDDALVRDIAQAEELPINVVPLTNRGRRKSDANPASQAPDADALEMLEHVDELTARVRKLEREKAGADELLESQKIDVRDLRESLNEQEQEADAFATEIKDRDKQIIELRKKLDDSAEALRRGASEARELAARLKEEKRAAGSARTEANRAKRRVEKLEDMKSGLQEKTRELRAELREAKKIAGQLNKVEIALEKSEAERDKLLDSVSQLDELRSELAAKDAKIDELGNRLNSVEQGHTQLFKTLSPPPDDVDTPDYPEDDEDIAPIVAFQVIRDGKIERVFQADNSRILIGRGEDASLRLESDFVSRHHALLFCSALECHVEDLNSSNGTIINGQPVSRCRLKPGQLMVVGDFIIRPVAAKD